MSNKKTFLILASLLIFSNFGFAAPPNLDINITHVDGWDDSKAMPSFSYEANGNLAIDFNIATDTNYGTTWADLNYSLTNTQGSGTQIVKGLAVDGNKCQTNFIGGWNNFANSDVNLVGYWKFDSDNGTSAWDFSGKGNTGIYTGGADNNAQGKWDTNAGFFDGIDNYVSIADSASLTFNNATNDLPFSVSMWVNFKAIAGKEIALVGKYLDSGAFNAEWNTQLLDNGAYYFQCLGVAAYQRIKITSSFTANTGMWNHVIFTYDGSGSQNGMNIYVNGVQDTSPTRANDSGYTKMSNYSAPVEIGAVNRYGGIYASYMNGSIDEVKIYDKALTANEILKDYTLGTRNFRTCSYDWNISGISDANYYANVLARDDASNSKFNSSNNSFRVNPGGTPPIENTPPLLAVWQVDGHDFNAALPSFSYAADGNLTIKFWAADVNDNDLNFNMWYDTASGGKTNKLIGDINLSTETGHGSCNTNNKTGMACTWDWNISGIADGNYWVVIELNDGEDTNTVSGQKSFRVNPAANTAPPDATVLYPMNNESFNAGNTIDINIAISDPDTNAQGITIGLSYSTSPTEGTGTSICNDCNLSTMLDCDSNNLSTSQQCKYSWNTTGISANNYYILAKVSDPNQNTDFDAGTGTFSISTTTGGKLRINANLNITKKLTVGQDANFLGNVKIEGTLFGGSPVKMKGGINVEGGITSDDYKYYSQGKQVSLLDQILKILESIQKLFNWNTQQDQRITALENELCKYNNYSWCT